MNVSLVSAEALTPEHLRLWSEWQRGDATLHSPFLRPEFTQQAATVCPGIEVAVIQQDGGPAGFFPFQRTGRHVARPVAGPLCDFQAVVTLPGSSWTPEDLLRGCRLNAWHFHHLVASQDAFRRHHYCSAPSFYMDLSKGYDAYCAERNQSGSHQIRRTLQKARKLGREIGPLRFEAHTADRQVFETLVRWKVQHYQRINAINFLDADWTRELLTRLIELRDDCFRGLLSALYCGDRLVAVHLGIRSCEVLHSWFPAYDPQLADYSPGAILFLQLAQEAPGLGIQRIDLGRGDERFKVSLGSGAVAVAQGSVDLRPMSRLLRRGSFRFFRWLRTSPLQAPAKVAGCLVPRLRCWATFHS